ncbi:hypothetical protein QJQ45_029878 [Haematococcus lacustris]|nr:hypothetical protein QJQ45_029878 [Haematococcus lacustris]
MRCGAVRCSAMFANLFAYGRCVEEEVAPFMREVAGLATAPRTDLKLSRTPGVLYDTVGSLRTPRPQDWLEAVQAQVQPWLPHMDALSAEDRSWLLSCLALDLQAQLPDAFLYQMLAPLAAHANNAILQNCSHSTLVRLLQLVQHTSRAPASHAWSAKLLAAVELRLVLKRPPQCRNPTAEDIAGEASLSRCIATALDCLPAVTSTGLQLLNQAHGQEQSGQGPVPLVAAQGEVDQAKGGVGQGQKADICSAARRLGLGLALACLQRRHVKHLVLVPDLLAKTVVALRQLEVKPPLAWLKEFEQVATSLVPSMTAPLLARCLVSLHLLGHTPSLLLVDMAAKVLRQSLEGMAAAHPVDLALGLAGLYAALADPQRAQQDSAGQQVESVAQTARLLAKAWLPCHKTKPDLLLALPRAELLLVSQALQAMLCSPNTAKQGVSQVLMAVADGSVGLVKSQALAALTPDSGWLVLWTQAMDVQQSAQTVNRSPGNQTSSDAASRQEDASTPLQLITHDASSSEEEGEEGEGSSFPFLGAGAAGDVKRLSPPSALQVAYVALETAVTVAPLSLGLSVAWPKPLVALVKDSLGVLAAQLDQGKVLNADMDAVEHYLRSVAKPLEGELPMSFMEAYVGRAMQDLGRAVMTLDLVIDLHLVVQARTLRQQITDLAQKLAGTSSLDAGGLHQLAALVTYLPLVRVQDEPSSPAWCWHEVKLQLQLVVHQCLHSLTLPSTIVKGAPGEDGAAQAVTLDLPTCLALCTCAAFVTSAAPVAPPSPDTTTLSQPGVLQLPPRATLALRHALQQLRDFAVTPRNQNSDVAATIGHSALHQQLQALGWAHALTLTLPASPAVASQEQHQADTQDVLLHLPSRASCVAWPGPIPGKQLAAVLDSQQLAKLQAATNTDHQAELLHLHLRLAQLLELLSLSGALDQVYQALTEELRATGGSTRPGPAAARRAPDRHSSSKGSSSGVTTNTTVEASSPQALLLQQASGTVSTLLRLAWQEGTLHHYAAQKNKKRMIAFLHITARLLPLLAPSEQPGQHLDWATALSPLGTEPEAVQALRCLMMGQVMSCAVQLALSIQQPGSHSELSGTAQRGQQRSLGAVTVLQRHEPDNPLSVAPVPPAATQASAPTTDYQVQQHLEAAARAAELEEGGRERGSAAQLAAWPPGLRDQVQAQLLCSQAWPAGWVSVVDALVGRVCVDIALTPDLLTAPKLAGILRKLQAAGYAPAQGVAKALLSLLALPIAPRLSLSLKTTLVLLVYGVVREPHSLQELDQVLDRQAHSRLQEAHVKPAVPAQAAGFPFIGGRPLQSWTQLLLKRLAACANTLYGWREEVELLRGSMLMTTAQQLVSGDDLASMDGYKVLAYQLTGRCSQYLPASHFHQVRAAGSACFTLFHHGSVAVYELCGGYWAQLWAVQQALQPFCLIPPNTINSLLQLGLRALGSEHCGSSRGGGVVGAAGAAGTLEGGAVYKGQESFAAMLFNGGPHVVGRYDSFWRASLLYAVAKRHPEAEAGLVQQALERLLSPCNTKSTKAMFMPLEALLVVVEPHLCPASPTTAPAPLPEELPIKYWLEMADWSNFKRPTSTAIVLMKDGSDRSEWQSWGPRWWALLFSLWINCPPFKTLFLNRLVEEQLFVMPPSRFDEVGSSLVNALSTGLSALSKAASLGLQAISPRSPPPSTPSSSGSKNSGPTGAQAMGGQAQLADEPSTQHSPAAPTPSRADPKGLQEAELALALLRMGLPGNMFERGAPLHPDLRLRLVLWGRWEWYTNILRSARLGKGSREPLPGPGAPQSQLSTQGFGQQSQQQLLQHKTTLGQGTSDSAGRAGPHDTSEPPDDVTTLLLSVQFAVEHEGTFLEAQLRAGCPYDLHTQLRLPKSWPVNNDSISARQLQQLLLGTVDALVQLPDTAVLGPGVMAVTPDVVSHRRKLFEMYAASHSGSSNDSGPPLADDALRNSPTASKRDVSLVVGAEFLLRCELNKRDGVISDFMTFFDNYMRRGGGGGMGGGGGGAAMHIAQPGSRAGFRLQCGLRSPAIACRGSRLVVALPAPQLVRSAGRVSSHVTQASSAAADIVRWQRENSSMCGFTRHLVYVREKNKLLQGDQMTTQCLKLLADVATKHPQELTARLTETQARPCSTQSPALSPATCATVTPLSNASQRSLTAVFSSSPLSTSPQQLPLVPYLPSPYYLSSPPPHSTCTHELLSTTLAMQELFAQLVESLVPLAPSLDSSQLLDCLAALALPLALSAGTPPPASLVERASKGRSSAAAQSKLNAAEAHHGLLHHTRCLLLAALPGALRDATPRRLMALLHSLQELQPELRLEPGVAVQVVQLLVQGLMGAHRRFLSDCSAKELVELAALLQASPDWRQHVTPSLVQGLQAALRRTVLAKATPAPAANGVFIQHSTTFTATTSQELTVLPDQVPAAAQLTSFLMALPPALQPAPDYLVALGSAGLRAEVLHTVVSEPVLVMALSLLASPAVHALGLEAKQRVVDLVGQALLLKPSQEDGEGDKQALLENQSQTQAVITGVAAAAAVVKPEPGSAAAHEVQQQPWPSVSCPSFAALLARLGRVCAAQPGLHLAPQLLPAVAAHVVAVKQAQQPGTGQQAVRELEGVVMQQAVQLGSLAMPTAAKLSPLLLISDTRSLEGAVNQLVTQLTAQREAAAAAATVLLLDWQEHAEEAVRQSELDTLLQLPRLAAVVGQPLGCVLQPVFESQLVQLSQASSGGKIKEQQLLFENTDRFQQVRGGSWQSNNGSALGYEVLAWEVEVSDLVLLLNGMAASGWGGASLMYDRVMMASLSAMPRCEEEEVAPFMRAVAGLATAPRTDLKLSRRPGVLYDTVGSLRPPRPQDWLEAVQAQVQPWLPHMDTLSAEDRSWLLSCLALDLQAQLPDAFLYQMLAPLAAHANNATLQECSPSTLVRLLQLVQHTSRAPASHAWSDKLLAAVELRLVLKPPEDIAGEAKLSRCIATALDCLPAFTSTGLRLLNPAHGQTQFGEGSDPPAAAPEEVDQARGSVGQGQEADICSAARRLGLGLALACLKRRHVKHLVLVPDLLAKTVFAMRQLEVKPLQKWLKKFFEMLLVAAGLTMQEFEQVATSLVPSMSAPLLARCLVSLHLLGHTPSLLLVDMAAKVLRQSLEGMAAAHPVDLALGLAGLYAALADPQRAHQDSAGQQAESIAQTARLLAKAWLPCHKTKPDLLLALPRAELLLVSQALQAMLCSPNAVKQGSSQVLMAMADGSVGLARSQALAALTPESVWLVRWAQAMDVQQSAQAPPDVRKSPDSQTSSNAASKVEVALRLITHDASSSEEEGEVDEGSSVPSLGAGAAGGVEHLSPPSAVQVAHVALETAITVAPLSLGLNVVWPKPLVALVKGSLGVLAAQLEQGKVLDADMAAVEQYVRSLAQPLGGELPISLREAYISRAMKVRRGVGKAVVYRVLYASVNSFACVLDLRLTFVTSRALALAGLFSFLSEKCNMLACFYRWTITPLHCLCCWQDLGSAVMALEFVMNMRLVLQARTLRQQITDLAQKLAGTSSLNAGGLHQLAALVTYLPLVRVQDEPFNPAWCWHEVKLQLQLVVLQCLQGLTLPYTIVSGAPGEHGSAQAATLDLPTCLALCTCAAFVTSKPSSQSGVLQLPPRATLALHHALQQLRDFALTPHNENSDVAASITAAAGSAGHSAVHKQLQAFGWAHALTLTLPANPACASQEQHQAATQDVLLHLPSSAGCVAWPGPIPGKQLAAVLDLQQLAKLQAASNTDHQAELFRLHLRLAQVCAVNVCVTHTKTCIEHACN